MNRELSANSTLSHYRIVAKIRAGVYVEVQREASRCLRRERPGHTLVTTNLIDADH